MKIRYTLLYICPLVICMMIGMDVCAQDNLNRKDSVKLMKTLNDQLSKKNDEILSLQSKIKQYEDDSAAYVTTEEYKMLQELLDAIQRLQTDTANAVGNMNQSISDARGKCTQSKAEYIEWHKRDSVLIVRLTKERDELILARNNYFKGLIASVDGQWLKKSFAQMSLAELDNACAQFDEYPDNRELAVAGTKLKTLRNDFRIYNQGMTLLKNKYNSIDVARGIVSVKELCGRTANQVKKRELTELINSLSSYKGALVKFQTIIQEIDKLILEELPQKAFNRTMRAVIGNQQGAEDAIKAIPWLNEQYELYCESMRNDYKKHSQVRDLIMSLKP